MKSVLITLSLLTICTISFGQKTIKGQVIDNLTKTTLMDVNIIIVGSAYGTITNDSGYFEFESKYKNSMARLSYVGYADYNIKLTPKNSILVELTREVAMISTMNIGLGEYDGPNQYIEQKDSSPTHDYEELGISKEEFDEVFNEEAEEIFTIVESNAEFYGGLDNLYAFFAANFQYPKKVLEENLRRTVFMEFIVLSDGSVDKVKFLKDDVLDEVKVELERLFTIMPKWIPATQRGVNVEQKFVLPIQYAANK